VETILYGIENVGKGEIVGNQHILVQQTIFHIFLQDFSKFQLFGKGWNND
jgi:hypothetical protein